MMRRISSLVLVCALCIGVSSCEKFKENRKTTTIEDMSRTSAMFDELFKSAASVFGGRDLESSSRSGFTFSLGNCAEIYVSSFDSVYPKKVIIDYGDTVCTGTDGRQRTGRIIIEATGRYRDKGTVLTITPDNYEVDGYLVEGKKVVENVGENDLGNMMFKISVTNGKVARTDGSWESTWESERLRTWTKGASTILVVSDDEYVISGTANGVNSAGRSYEVEITKDIHAKLDCRYVVEGIIEVRPDELKTRTIDYGNGVCDNKATFEVGNRSSTIEL